MSNPATTALRLQETQRVFRKCRNIALFPLASACVFGALFALVWICVSTPRCVREQPSAQPAFIVICADQVADLLLHVWRLLPWILKLLFVFEIIYCAAAGAAFYTLVDEEDRTAFVAATVKNNYELFERVRAKIPVIHISAAWLAITPVISCAYGIIMMYLILNPPVFLLQAFRFNNSDLQGLVTMLVIFKVWYFTAVLVLGAGGCFLGLSLATGLVTRDNIIAFVKKHTADATTPLAAKPDETN